MAHPRHNRSGSLVRIHRISTNHNPTLVRVRRIATNHNPTLVRAVASR